MIYRLFGKRILDLLLTVTALVAVAPLVSLVAVLIKLEDRGPVIFKQQRVGRGGKPFTLFKFRSMPVDSPHLSSDAARDIRITRVGRLIRRTNIDELPQLTNILRGEMSVVGPRPALLSQTELIARRRANGAIDCVPGLTGLAQVNATDGMSVEAKANWDGEYARSLSALTDATIVLRTVRYLLSPPPTY